MSHQSAVPFPFEFKEFDEDLAKLYPDAKERFIFVGPKNYCVPIQSKTNVQSLYNFQVRPDDVWLFGLPRSGTTLTSEAVWLLCNDLNYEKAREEVLQLRLTVLGHHAYYERLIQKVIKNPEIYSPETVKICQKLSLPTFQSINETSEKRFIKTHLPMSLAPKDILRSGCKIIYVARNPKDVVVSNFHYAMSTMSHPYFKDFGNFWKMFQQGIGLFIPYFEHVKEGWEIKDNPNVLFLFYEEYVNDSRKTLLKLATFLDKKLTEEELDILVDHLKIDNFRKNKSVNKDWFKEIGGLKEQAEDFIRKGQIGGWRDCFTKELNAEADQWIQDNLNATDIQLPK